MPLLRSANEKRIAWADIPPATEMPTESTALEISQVLRQLLEHYEESEFIKYLVTPSPDTLRSYFNCSQDDLIQALEQLKSQGYDYETHSPERPITLWDPLIRNKPSG